MNKKNQTSEDENEKKETENILRDIIYNTETSSPENKKYIDVIKKIYEPVKVEHKRINTVFNSMYLSDLLEYSSFKDIERMKKIVSDLNLLIIELEKYDKKMLEIKDNARNIAMEDLGEVDGEKAYLSFEEGFSKTFVYIEKCDNAEKKYFSNIISLYNFLIANYNDYEIDYDEYGEENIYFYSDYNLNKFNQYTEKNNRLYESYLLSEKEYNNYVNNNLKEYGMSIKDIESYYLEK